MNAAAPSTGFAGPPPPGGEDLRSAPTRIFPHWGKYPRSGGRGSFAAPFLAALFALFFSTLALAAPTFPKLTGRVVDDAHVLSPQVQADLTTKLAALEQSTGRQLVVVTLPSLQGDDIADYGYQLGRAWGIGQKGQNNGVLFIVAPSDRKVRIEVGYGLEPILTDALSSVILHRAVLPKFRAGDVQGGVVDGTGAIIEQLTLPEADAKARVAQAQQAPQGGRVTPGSIIGLLILFWVLASFLGAMGGRGRGGGSAWWLLPLLLSGGGGRGGGWSGGGGASGGW